MQSNRIGRLATVAACVALTVALGCGGSGPRPVRLEVRGAAGTRVSVEVQADGAKSAFEADLPLDLDRTAASFAFDVKKIAGPGEAIRVEVFSDGTLRNSTASLKGVYGVLELNGPEVREASITGR